MIKAGINTVRSFCYFNLFHPWIRYGRNVHVHWSTLMWSPHKKITIGNNVGFGPKCFLQCDIEIGDNVLIAAYVAFLARDAHLVDKVGLTIWESGQGFGQRIVVEDDVWIGHGAIILSGVRIGRGAVVAAGSIVTRDIPPYAIVGSPPTVILKYRFSPEDIRKHEVLRQKNAAGRGAETRENGK